MMGRLGFVGFRLALVGMVCGFSGGCQAPGGRGTPAGSVASSQPGAPGSTQPAYDPEKAFLKLAQIPGDPELPAPATTQPVELPGQAVRQIVAGKTLCGENRFTEAIFELERALRYAPQSFEINQLLAIVCRRAGNDGRAISHLKKAVEVRPDDVVCRYLLGLYAAQDKKNEEALREFRLALKCSNATEDNAYRALTHYRLAELLRDQGYLRAAADQFEAFTALVSEVRPSFEENTELVELVRLKRSHVTQQVADIYRRLGNMSKAIDALAEVADQFPEDVALQSMYARLLSSAGRHDDAIRVSQQLVTAKPAEKRTIVLLMEVCDAAGKAERAIESLGTLRKQRPEDIDLATALFEALVKRERFSEAENLLLDLVAGRPNVRELRWLLIRFYETRQRWAEAVAAAGSAVEADPAQAKTVGQLIDRLASNQDAVQAVMDRCGELLTEKPESYGLPYVVGLLAARTGDRTRALQLQQLCVQKRPDFTPGFVALCEVHLKRHAWQQAILIAKKALADGLKEAAFERVLGQAYDGLDDIEQAATHYAEAIRLQSQDMQSMLLLARLYERSGQTNRAQRQYKNMLSINPGMHAAREALFTIYASPPIDLRSTGTLRASSSVDLESAKAQLQKFQKYGADTPAYARCVRLLQLRVRQLKAQVSRSTGSLQRIWTDYADAMADIAEKFPDDVESVYTVAASRFVEKNYDEALDWCNRALTLDPDHVPARELLGWIYRRQLKYPQAREVFETLLSERPNRETWRLGLAEQHLIDQNFNRAVDVYEALLDDPKAEASEKDTYRLILVDALQLAGRTKEAVERIDPWIQQSDKPLNYRLWKLLLLEWAGQTAQGVAFARTWYENDPNNKQARLRLFQALLRYEKPFDALRYVLEWLADDPENKLFSPMLVEGLTAAERFDEAIEMARNGVLLTGQKTESLQRLAEVYRVAGMRDKRVQVLQQVARRQQDSNGDFRPEDALSVIQALISANRYPEAEQQLTLRVNEEKSPAARRQWSRLLSFCYLRNKKVRLAAKVLDDILEQYPNDAHISNDLGYTLADAGLELDRAEKLVRFAVGEEPRNNAYLDSLGWVLYKKGDFAGAKEWLSRAVRARSILSGSLESVDDPLLYDHLGDALWQLGEQKEAVASWNKAVRICERFRRQHVDRDDAEVLENAKHKIKATQNKQAPPVAPSAEKNAA